MKEPPEELVDLFRKLDVDHPEVWASSEFNEDICQSGRATVLRNAADLVMECSRPENIRKASERSPIGRIAVDKLNAQNADWDAVGEVCQQVLSDFLWLYFRMSDGMDEPYRNPADINWSTVAFDNESGRQMGVAGALYESLYHMLEHVSGRERW